MKRKIVSFLAIMVLMLSLAGCGSVESAESVFTKAIENSGKAKSMDAVSTIELVMEAEGQTVNMKADADMTVFTDPYKAMVSMKMDMGELGALNSDVYMVEEDGKFTTYTGMADTTGAMQWMKQDVDEAQFSDTLKNYDSSAYLESFKKSSEGFEVEEVEEDGKKLYKLTGKIMGDEIGEVIKSSGVLDQMSGLGMNPGALDNISEDMGDIKVVSYVDQKSAMLTKMSLDMTGVMEKLMKDIFASQADVTVPADFKISKCLMDMEYENFDAAEDFEIPEEAVNAQEADFTELMEEATTGEAE